MLNDEAAAQPVVDTVVEPLNQPAGSTRRQSKPPTPTRNRFAPLCSAALLLLLRSG